MLRRDYLVKKFEEFGKVLAVMLGLKRDGKWTELDEALQTAAVKYIGADLPSIESLGDDLLIQTLTSARKFTDEQLKMSADLLYEKAAHYAELGNEAGTRNCFTKARIMYEFIQTSATLPYSLDTHYKLEFLKQYFTEQT